MTEYVKIVVFVPHTHAGPVRQAAGDAGAGRIGFYSHCSYTSEGIGRFQPLAGARPTIGEVGKTEEVMEERVEFVCKRIIAREVLDAVRKVHPYEEVAFDIYPLIMENDL